MSDGHLNPAKYMFVAASPYYLKPDGVEQK